MPRAATLEEKKQKSLDSLQSKMSGPEPTPAADGRTRRKRGVFNGTEGKLKVNGTIPGYHLHILNDDGTRIKDAQDNGYEFVAPQEIDSVTENVVNRNGDLGDSRIRFLVGTNKEGHPMYGYLMKIKLEWYEEDQVALQSKNDKIDTAIRGGRVTGDNPAFYTPKDGIKLST